MVNKKYNVEGMSCSACSAAVERVVKRINGVSKAEVNLVAKLLRCEYDESLITDADVIKAIEKAGFSATVIEDKKRPKPVPSEDVVKTGMLSVKFRLIFSIAILLPLMYLSMGRMLGFPVPWFMSADKHPLMFALAQLILATPMLYVNRKFFYSGTKALFHRAPNMDTLVMTGSGISYLFSIFAIIMMAYGLEVGDVAKVKRYVDNLYFESSAMILTLITIGKGLEEKAKRKTGSAIDGLKKLSPDTTTIIVGGVEKNVKTSELKIGDLVIVKNGQSVPVDGIITKGNAYINQSAITGESLSVYKGEGDSVISASVCTDGFIVVKATAVGTDTTLSKIIDLVRDAGATKAPIAKIADKISGIFVPVVMAVAVVTLVVWLAIGYNFELALVRAVSVLVISCPCALGLATPVAVTASVGAAARRGVLIKSAGSLELLAKTNTVIFDKTGTLTTGNPKVNELITVEGVSEKMLKSIALTLEVKNSHPLAKAVVSFCDGSEVMEAENYNILNGRGVACTIDGESYATGNLKYMKEIGVDISPLNDEASKLYGGGNTVLWFSKGNTIIGLMSVSDEVKSNAKNAVTNLQEMGVDVAMLSGDNKSACEAVREKLGINFAFSDVLPDGKEKTVADVIDSGKTVTFVGDGINDSPALALAHVGIALGDGTAVAIDTADVVLLNGNIEKVADSVKRGKRTLRIIKQNLFWAFFYNVILIPVAAGVFSFAGIVISPMLGALAMSISSLFVVTNALRLLK